MQSNQTLGWLLVFILVPVGVFLQCFTESVFILNPLIDTTLPQGFTEANFNKIQPKMTKAEVSRIIQAEPDQISKNEWRYGQDGAAAWGDYAWFSFRILFDKNGKVITAERLANYD